jgi:hypothetical protein
MHCVCVFVCVCVCVCVCVSVCVCLCASESEGGRVPACACFRAFVFVCVFDACVISSEKEHPSCRFVLHCVTLGWAIIRVGDNVDFILHIISEV